MTERKGYPAYPAFSHYLEPMFVPTDSEVKHHCHLCRPEFYVTLAPGFTACARCGVVILTGNEDDPKNEAMEVCEKCWLQIGEAG